MLACVGETQNMNGEGASRADISIPDAQLELLKALKATGKPVVLVLVTGRPLTLVWESENMDAILNVWSQGSEGGNAIADVLFGDVNPSGKLTTSFPRSVGQLPLYYNHKSTGRPHPDYEPYRKFTSCYIDVLNGPLYPFGYGLSYTSFEYSDFKLSAGASADAAGVSSSATSAVVQMPANGSVKASVRVTNTGERSGKETVQLYIHDVYASSTRPVRELRGFEKISLEPGESKTVEFEIDAQTLGFYNHELQFVCEPGVYEIMVGPDCERLQTLELEVQG